MYVLYCFILYGIGEHCMCCVVRVQLYSIVRHWVHNYTLYIVCNCLGKSEQWRASGFHSGSRYSTKWWWCSNCCDLESQIQIQKLRVTKFKWCQQTCGGAALELLWSCSFWDLITPNHLLLTSLSSTSGGAFMALVTPIRSCSLTLAWTESTCSSCSWAALHWCLYSSGGVEESSLDKLAH